MPLIELLLLRPTAYRHACENRRAPFWISAFLFLIGMVYGVLVALLQRALGGAIGGVPVADIPVSVLILGNILPGILIAIMVHIGVMLVSWLMAKAAGGPGELGLLYRATGYLLPLLLPLLPAVAFHTASATMGVSPAWPMVYSVLAVLGAALFLAGLFQVFRVTQNFQPARAAFAVALFAAFTASILSLA